MGEFVLNATLLPSRTSRLSDAITLMAKADGADILRQMEAAKVFLRPHVSETDHEEGRYIDVVVFEIEQYDPEPCRASICCTGPVVSPRVSDDEDSGNEFIDGVMRNLTVRVYGTTKRIPWRSDLKSGDPYIHYVYKVGGKVRKTREGGRGANGARRSDTMKRCEYCTPTILMSLSLSRCSPSPLGASTTTTMAA